MDMNPSVDGAYLECDVADLLDKTEATDAATVLVVREARIELCGKDLEQFRARFKAALSSLGADAADMTSSQRAFAAFRRMVVADGLLG